MVDRLNSLDASFLSLEDATTPMHVGSVMVFEEPETGFDYERLVRLITTRIAGHPRYRQRVRHIPGRIANPVWIDDENFDITYHVRQSALPAPGTDGQLEELVARIQPRLLDRSRPLWEVYYVEGLAEGRFAIITKSHHALVDGVNAEDVANLIVDTDRADPSAVALPGTWRPEPEPGAVDLVATALLDVVRRPGEIADNIRGGVTDARAAAGRVLSGVGEVAAAVVRASTRPAPQSPLNTTVGRGRNYVMVGTDLDDYKTVRARVPHGSFAEEVTVHDVVLATIAGAFRTWLLTRGESVHAGTTIRAMVPVSIYPDELSDGVANEVQACFVDLPVGEPGPSMRLHQIAFAMRQQIDGGRAVEAGLLTGLAGFASPTLHSLGSRVGSAISRRLFNLVITNVPGPQRTLYAGDAPMMATYPVMPLSHDHALSIGLTSYDGGVYYGLNADRVALPDLDVFGACIVESLAELLTAHRKSL